jgi:hypothetical protein
VDATVGAHIWEEVVVKLLLQRGKTVITATHAVNYGMVIMLACCAIISRHVYHEDAARRKEVTQVIVLEHGTTAAVGSYEDVLAVCPHITGLAAAGTPGVVSPSGSGISNGGLSPITPVSLTTSAREAEAGAPAPSVAAASEGGIGIGSTLPDEAPDSGESDKPIASSDGDHDPIASAAAASGEEYAVGAVRPRYLWKYLRSFGPAPMLIALLSLYLLSQALTIAVAWWMTQWTEAPTAGSVNASSLHVVAHYSIAAAHIGDAYLDTSASMSPAHARLLAPTPVVGSNHSPLWFAAIYAALNGGLALVSLIRMMVLAAGAIRASTALHNGALSAVLASPASFFADNPAGRITNRFLSDVSTVDNQVRYSVSSLATLIFQLVGVIAVLVRIIMIIAAIQYTAILRTAGLHDAVCVNCFGSTFLCVLETWPDLSHISSRSSSAAIDGQIAHTQPFHRNFAWGCGNSSLWSWW